MQSGLIFDVKRFAINDGPGIRVTVFFKGCPQNCAWCHNPESISPRIQKLYTADKCIGCQSCVEACPEQACILTPQGIVTDKDACMLCGICADVCPTKATEMSGRKVSVEDVLQTLEKDRAFFDQSGGGVTFSGGEPLHQPDFLIALLKECGERTLHRVVDTAGIAPVETILEVAKHTDLFLFDLKMMDSSRHKKWTGANNEIILGNLTALAEAGARIIIRIPVIKGVNHDSENIEQTARFVAGLPGDAKTVNLLAYHNIAANKFLKLGEAYDEAGMSEPDSAVLKRIVATFAGHGVTATVGG